MRSDFRAANEVGEANAQPLDDGDFPPFAPASAYEEEAAPAEPPREFAALDLAMLAQTRPSAKEMAIERLAPAGEVTLLSGPGSAGKSLLCQQLATAAASGRDCLGLAIAAGPAIYVTCEDDPDQLHWRQEHICGALRVDMPSLAGRLHLYSLRGELDTHLGTYMPDGRLVPSTTFDWLARTIGTTGARLIALDNIGHLFTGNENDRGHVTRFINLLNRLAGVTGAAILLIGHPNKAGASYSGSTAWLNAVRSQVVIELKRDADGETMDPDARTLSIGKANYARLGQPIAIRWREWAFIREDDLPTDERADLAATIQASADNEIFLRCLNLRNEQRRPVSENKHSRTYAPKEFAEMAESKRIGRARLEAAMNRLYRIKAVDRLFLWRDDAEGKDRFGLRRVSADPSADLPLTVSADIPPTARSLPLSTADTHSPLKGGREGPLGGPSPSPEEPA